MLIPMDIHETSEILHKFEVNLTDLEREQKEIIDEYANKLQEIVLEKTKKDLL